MDRECEAKKRKVTVDPSGTVAQLVKKFLDPVQVTTPRVKSKVTQVTATVTVSSPPPVHQQDQSDMQGLPDPTIHIPRGTVRARIDA